MMTTTRRFSRHMCLGLFTLTLSVATSYASATHEYQGSFSETSRSSDLCASIFEDHTYDLLVAIVGADQHKTVLKFTRQESIPGRLFDKLVLMGPIGDSDVIYDKTWTRGETRYTLHGEGWIENDAVYLEFDIRLDDAASPHGLICTASGEFLGSRKP